MNLSVGLGNPRTLDRGRIGPASRPPRPKARSRNRRPRGGFAARLSWLAFCALLAALLLFGWSNRNERHWVPDTGVGYWLGIAGASVLLALLIYPLRKRFRTLRFLGSVPIWFRLHMAMGLLGPALILLHCNFKSESLNATVALNAMLIVAGSGLIGKFLYSHVHSTLSGQRLAATGFFDGLMADSVPKRGNPYFGLSERSLERVSNITKNALASPGGLLSAIGHASLVRWQSRQLARSIGREISVRNVELMRVEAGPRKELCKARKEFERDVAAHLAAVRKAAGLAIYEHLFALWHFLHMPLFMMLVLAAVAHVIAVHLY